MTLERGSRIGPYEIQSALGAGGMGEVYRARDTRLGRTVAIKILRPRPDQPKGPLRLEREALAISRLSHPNICALYDIGEDNGVSFLVMEYLSGETLACRLLRGAMPLDEALNFAIEIVSALDHAHRHGIVHRDLKPSNVMLTQTGAKLLDFGLAAPQSANWFGDDSSGDPRTVETLTAEGAIVGTIGYMAPEQLQGLATDARSDIFAFGAIGYEMVTGRRAFEGANQATTIAAILERTPEAPSAVFSGLSGLVESTLMKCLAKAPDDRWQTAADLKQALKWASEGTALPRGAAQAPPRTERIARHVWLTAAAVGLFAAGITAVVMPGASPAAATDTRAVRFTVSPPESIGFTQSPASLSISPDGQALAFVGSSDDGKLALWLRSLDSLAARPLTESGGTQPFWSPDSRFIGFSVDGNLLTLDVAGDKTPHTLADAFAQAGSWSRDGIILFKATHDGPLSQVPAGGGPPIAATTLDASLGEISHEWPFFLPDGRHFLYLARTSDKARDGRLYVGSLDSSERVALFTSDSQAVYAPPGRLLYMLGGDLVAQAFDVKGLRLSGDRVVIAERVDRNPGSRRGAFSVSQNGVLVYRTVGDSELVWFDRSGTRMNRVGEPGGVSNPALSPDDGSLAFQRVDARTRTPHIWVTDLKTGVTSRITSDPAAEGMPLWWPDGSRIVFRAYRGASFTFLQKVPRGADAEEMMLSGLDVDSAPLAWSADSRLLVYTAGGPQDPVSRQDLWILPWAGDRKPVPFLRTRFNEFQARISPDGQWIAYTSNESGRNEVYVRPFPAGEPKYQISAAGGTEPMWRGDGKELFYLAGNQDLMSVPFKAAHGPAIGPSAALFRTTMSSGLVNVGYTRNQYVVASDGQRFLINVTASAAPTSPISVVLNWPATLKK